ncbi:artemin [Neophocaena asiaeorientalis asiaeorientalis]|uniref:Artemin n=1 Tax=Neophocaena asiaeorientalis asiaeorientalis TaxID=1706337 RepID=A0A341CMY0_NEOAA|nr:artemin [Neophocaena asiaeorientalis asiaeorientalis]
MEPGRGSPSVLPLWPRPRRQPALWPTLAALALLSSIAEGEASLGPAPSSPVPREGPVPAPAPPCRLRSQLVPVRALGLGHHSDELVRFRFCSGSCRRARSPHDLSLASLLGAGALRPPPGSRPVSQPCCRPTRYEAVSFMDVNSTWRTVDRLSATACGCLG